MSLITPKKSLGILSLSALVALLAVFAFGNASQVAHADQEDVPASAGVTSSGVQPHIECKWELPDVNSGSEGIQYGQDNEPAINPNFPCNRGEGGVGVKPQQADGVKNVIQVVPNAEDLPEARRIENWAAVDHPNGVDEIDDVFWKVFHPDGSFKIQIHGTRVEGPNEGIRWVNGYEGDDNADNPNDYNLEDLGGYNASGTMFWAAGGVTGQITQDAIHADDWGMLDLIRQRQKDLWYADWQIHKEQLCGEYFIEVTAVANGEIGTLTNTLDIICFYNLEIDFETVNWGTITPGGSKVLPGDTNFGSSDFPTVKNTGNSGMQVGVHFTKLLQVGVPGPKEITVFDAAFGKSASVLEWIDPIPAEQNTWFNNESLNQVLCANEVGKLDLSIHPPEVIPSGSYAGTVTVLANWAPGLCHNGYDGNVSAPDGIPPTLFAE